MFWEMGSVTKSTITTGMNLDATVQLLVNR